MDGVLPSQNEYPWFLSTYISYPYDIQRVDAIRYFILHKYGGVYVDLDIGCNDGLDFMRSADFSAPMTYPVGISNDIMGAVPNSKFLDRIIWRLHDWNHWMVMQYIQVMFGTGPMFLTVQYATSPPAAKQEVAVIHPELYGKYDLSGMPALYHLHGSSWHAQDASFVFWLDRYKYVFVSSFCLTTLIITYWTLWVYPTRAIPKSPELKHIRIL